MNDILILIIELLGGLLLLLAVGYILSRVIGSDKYYDRMLYNDDKIVITKRNNEDSDDTIHQVSTLKRDKALRQTKNNFFFGGNNKDGY